ncbi:glycosyltransferase family 4 protein [Luteimonas terricola]|uniref:Glycosyl transferase family 1 n=1 Tax=Luteimonas terricola TaxID=645597 RepID=A0ABQ2EI38_9GAMM|nr:glycosyltransferase family 4 protein [Luteimonas terricola]GGK09117.1 glycosyl transferase family 1 [Luteimonas terricola]
MKVLYHHRTQGRRVEGVHIRGVANALRELGHEVRVVSFPGADPELEPGVPSGPGPAKGLAASPAAAGDEKGRLAGLVSRLPGVLFEFAEIGYNLLTWWRIRVEIARSRPDFIYERYSLFLFMTIWIARRRGIPVILEINDSAVVQRLRPLWLKPLARRIEAWCLTRATGIVFISTYFKELLTTHYGQLPPSVVSPNAVDARFDPGRHDRDELRRRHDLEGRVVCGHMGVFARWHGVPGFVEAIIDRLQDTPALTLLLVGDGADLPAVRREVEARGLGDRIRLPGRVPHHQIPEWIACMDYAFLPDSNEYGSPMKLFELMAMGVAVVAPDYDPIAEVIEPGTTGWLFPRKDMRACVDQVIELSGRTDERQRVGAAARGYIERERRWRNNATQLLSLLPGAGKAST